MKLAGDAQTASDRLGSMNPHSLATARLRLLYVPNPTPAMLPDQGSRGDFHLDFGGALIGHLSLVSQSHEDATIGYQIDPPFRRRGFAAEAVAAVTRAALEFGLVRLSARCRSDNAASRGVLEKSGFELISSEPWLANGGDSTLMFMVYEWIARPDVSPWQPL
jgi:GNAT superfamily N-acetyltransferase